MVPGKNDTGTNTAISTSDVAMTALVTSPIASEVASCGSECSMAMVTLHILDHHDGVVHHQARRQRDAEECERIDGKAEELDERERSDQRDRNGDRGNDGCAPVQQEQKDDDDDDGNGLAQRHHHFADGVADIVVESKAIAYSSPGGKLFESSTSTALRTPVHVQRVGVGELLHADSRSAG